MNKTKLTIRIIFVALFYLGYIYCLSNIEYYNVANVGIIAGYVVIMFAHALIGCLVGVIGFCMLLTVIYHYLIDDNRPTEDLYFSLELLFGLITIPYVMTKKFLITKEDK